MKPHHLLVRVLLIAIVFFLSSPFSVKAQGYIKQSRYLSGNGDDRGVGQLIISGGDKYILGNTSITAGNTYPVTTGGASPGYSDIVLTKLKADGSIAWSRFIGSRYDDIANAFIASGNSLYIGGSTLGNNFPVTDGSSFQGTDGLAYNAFLTKVNMGTGQIEFSTLMGTGRSNYIESENGFIYVTGANDDASSKITIARYDAVSNAQSYIKSYGGTDGGCFFGLPMQGGKSTFKIKNGIIYLAFKTQATDFPVTDGSTMPSANIGGILMKLDALSGSMSYSGYFGFSWAGVGFDDLQVDNGDVYLLGETYAAGFPVTTDGSQYSASGYLSNFIMKWNSQNSIVFSRVISYTYGFSYSASLAVSNGVIYVGCGADNLLMSEASTFSTTGDDDLVLIKLDASSGTLVNFVNWGSSSTDQFIDFKVLNGDVYVTGITFKDDYPVTNGSTYAGGGNSDIVVTKLNAANKICFSTYLGGANSDNPNSIAVVADSVFIAGTTFSNNFPVTDNSSRVSGGGDMAFTQFVFNPTIAGISDVTSPASQTACKNGLAQIVTAPEISLASKDMPTLYRNGAPTYQPAIIGRYQWQVADASTGPWADIPGAVQLNYTPQVQLADQYYRRLTYTSSCSGTPVSTSSVAEVIVSADVAPTVNAGGIFYTCSATPVTLGGSPTATPAAGSMISSYLWEPAGSYTPDNASANPSVSPTDTTIYTVTVTDDKGCKQIGQAIVNVYKANAGADKPTCAGGTVRIGSAPVAGLSGVIYSWSAAPADATMSCTNCAQPTVQPAVATTYTLSVMLPVTGGGTCTSTDDVIVAPVAAPTANFGGADITICNSGSGILGTTAQPGFTYTWAPGTYLDNANVDMPTFTPGNITMPNPNPFTYYVTAAKDGCSFVDEVKAYTIEANAGSDVCGPAILGKADRTPSINETYKWIVVSGSGHIIGADDQPQVSVSASSGANTVYQLSATYNGVTCTDDVTVTDCGCVLPVITVDAPFSCASYDVNGGNVKLTASSSIPVTFSWSPAAGLSSTTGAVVTLTDNVARTYTVTATSTIDPGVACTNTIAVNQPTMAKPSFTAQDVTVCPGNAVTIGQSSVAGYIYEWKGNGLDNNTISNPTATVNSTTDFPVLVTDIGSGCTARDTATVSIPGFPGNLSGPDIDICGSATVRLGSDPIAGLTYLWTPAATYMPDNTAANPEVLVAITTTFHVVATNTATGCTLDDDIVVTVKPAAPTFSFTDQTFCPSGGVAIALPAGPSSMSAYSWSPASSLNNATSNGPTATIKTPLPSTQRTYTLTITNADGCKSSADVKFTPSTPNPVAGSSRTACKNTAVQLGESPGMAGTYSWSVSASSGATYTMSATNISNPVFTPTSAGSFTITVSYTESGCTTKDIVTINAIDYTIAALASPTVCENTCVQIGISSAEAGATYAWSPVAGLSDAYVSNPTACVTNSNASYRLTVTGANGCIATQDVIVGVSNSQAPSVSVPTVNSCTGGGSITFQPNVSPVGSYDYLWTPDDGTVQNVYVKNATVYTSSSGSKKYYLDVTDPSNGCSSNAIATLNVGFCTLPVKLESFTAKGRQNDVLLEWQVSDEMNLAYYVVEHSVNGSSFSQVGTVAPTNRTKYQFVHNNPVNGTNYYRIKMIDMDGSVDFSGLRKINFGSGGKIGLYPNPANSIVHITFPTDMQGKKASLVVFAGDGRVVMKKQIVSLAQKESIAIESFPKGQYYVRVATENQVISKPLIIAR